MAKAKLDLSGRRRRCPRAPFTFLEASSQRSPPFDDRHRRRCGGTLPVHHQVTYKILHSPTRRTEALNANHSSTAPKTDGVRPPFPHSGCDRSPVRQLWSLLRHAERCGNTVRTCDAVRDVLGTAPVTILPIPAVRTPPHHTNGAGLVPCSGGDPASPRVPQGGMLSTSSQRPGPPPRGVRDLHVTPGPP